MKPQSKILLIGLLCVCNFITGRSQVLEAGFLGGLSVYNGDLSSVKWEDYFQDLNPAVGVFGRYELNRTLATRLQFTYTRLSASSGRNTTTPYDPPMKWRTDLAEVSLKLEVTPFRLYWFKKAVIQPYATSGLAVYHFNPKFFLDNRFIEVQPLGTEGQGASGQPGLYNRTQVSVPLGAGVRLNLPGRISIGAEFVGYLVFTDYLDDIGSTKLVYEDLRRLKGEEIARISNPDPRPGENVQFRRGNPARDYYYIGGVTIYYQLSDGMGRSGANIPCYKF